MRTYSDVMFTDAVKAQQTQWGSRNAYAPTDHQPVPQGLSQPEAEFIHSRDSFYMATVTETGWPYMQHRGGPAGFLKVLSPTQMGFADYRGNRQYISTGNLTHTDKAALFLMDYPNKRRLKLAVHASVRLAEDAPDLAEQLSVPGEGRVERLFLFDVEAFNWNCPQFITPRFTQDEVNAAVGPALQELEELRRENAALKEKLAAQT